MTETTTQKRFQQRVAPWVSECFGPVIANDRTERNHRFLEESLELVQALDCSAEEAHRLVDYVFSRSVGDPPQEVGGVRVTLSALCNANNLNEDECAETELERITRPEMVAKIREKQKAKPPMSPLPGRYPDEPEAQTEPTYDDACETFDQGLAALASALGMNMEFFDGEGAQAFEGAEGLKRIAEMLKPLGLRFDPEENTIKSPVKISPAQIPDEWPTRDMVLAYNVHGTNYPDEQFPDGPPRNLDSKAFRAALVVGLEGVAEDH